MSAPRKPRLLPGLLGGSLPLGLQAVSAALLVAWLGGLDGLSRTLGMAGRSIHLMGVLCLGCTVALALVLFLVTAGRNVPGVVPVVLATVPWLAGLSGALQGARSTIAAMASASEESRLVLLLQGTGELLCARLLGAWSSATLLLATAAALFLARATRADSRPGDRRLEAGVVLLVALLGALAAFESGELSRVLVATATVNPADQLTVLLAGAESLRVSRLLRPVLGVGLVLAGLALGARKLPRRPREPAALLTLLPLAVVLAGILWADGRPMARMSEALEQASQRPAVLSGLRLLPFGADQGISRVDVIATARGLSRPGGSEVPWSAGDKSLMDFLREPVAHLARQEPVQGEPPPSLELAVDAGLPVAELRRLIDLATQMELTTLCFVGTRAPESEAPRLAAALSGTSPFLQQAATALRSTPGTVRVILLPMLHSSAFQSAGTWVGELGAEPRVTLSEVPVGTKATQVLELAREDEGPQAFVERGSVLHLTVTEHASLEDVAKAVQRSRVQGFTVLLSARPPPGSRHP
ncbi:hypothetical protein [Hyalangium gracile]|uniref:hypothetical protein n=1 Tax=Hyalangium gracile TaxID=394092 RepID=UPI001CC973C6|nr:hypothetical protein [Hyalangium gracile]